MKAATTAAAVAGLALLGYGAFRVSAWLCDTGTGIYYRAAGRRETKREKRSA